MSKILTPSGWKKLSESRPDSLYQSINPNAAAEVAWTKKKIISLKAKYEKKPSTHKEIKDLERQIRERGGIPDSHDWFHANVNDHPRMKKK